MARISRDLKDLMPNAEHRFCVRHLYANFKKDFPGKVLKDAMWSAARAWEGTYVDIA